MVSHAVAETVPQPLPVAFEKSRYDGLHEHSPFSVASAAPAPATVQGSFAANWFVAGIARIGGTDFAVIKSRDQSVNFSLFGQEPDLKTNTVLASIEWSDSIGKSKVTLRKGNETATLEFNEAEMKSATVPLGSGAAAPMAANSPSSPGAPQQNVNIFPNAQSGVNARRRPEPQQPLNPQASTMGGGAGMMGGSMGGAFSPGIAASSSIASGVSGGTTMGSSAGAFSPAPASTTGSPISSTPLGSAPTSAPSAPSGSAPSTGGSPSSGIPPTDANLYTTAQSGVNAKAPVPEVW